MARSMTDRLGGAVPPPPPLPPGMAVAETVSDLKRILALPKRPPLNCQRDPRTRRYAPETQALIEVMTARFSRGKRLSCACRPRKATLGSDGALTIARVLPEGQNEVPLLTTIAAFVADNRSTAAEIEAGRTVAGLRVGEEIELKAADGGAGHPCIMTLNASQAWLLREAEQVGGIVGFCSVGSGKTISLLLAPLLFPDSRLAVLVIEPKQRQHYRSHYLRLREHFRTSSIVFDDGVSGHTVPGTPPLHLVSYSTLSQTKNSDILDRMQPDVLLLDESHRACSTKDSAIQRRIKRFIVSRIRVREEAMRRGEIVRVRAVRLLGGSGTLESKSVNDTQMLCAYALGTGSPLPIDPNEAAAWSAVIDPCRRPDRRSSTAKALHRYFGNGVVDTTSLDDLLSSAPEPAVRRGFRDRRTHTLGIISASATKINAALYFSERDVSKKIPTVVKDALTKVRTEWLTPGDDEIVEKIEQVACARNVASGFYAYWAFPKHPCTCPVPRAEWELKCDECRLIDDWYARRKEFNKSLRTKLLRGELHLDSPKLCEDAAERFWQDPPYKGSLPKWDCEAWPAWRDIENRVEHEERVKWLSEYLAEDAAEWAREHRGVVWFQSIALGRRVSEIAGLPYFNGGPGCEDRLRAEKGDRSIICSIPALGAGTDGLQHKFSTQLIMEVPASNGGNRGAEQVLGRLHREGQQGDAVETEAYLHVSELRDALRKARAEAEFNLEMTGQVSKLLLADFDVGEL